MHQWPFAVLALALGTSTARADDREFCPDRPGLTVPACTMAVGKLAAEVNLLDVSRKRNGGNGESTALFGDTLLRYGLTDNTEARLNWTTFGLDRSRDGSSGNLSQRIATGDVTLSLRQNFLNADGSGTSVALQPMVRLPAGQTPIGNGTWSVGLIAPVGFTLAEDWRLYLDPEVDAAANNDGVGRHLAYAVAAGVAYTLSKRWVLGADLLARRDLDPSRARTLVSVDGNLAYLLPGGEQEVYAQVVLGATPAAPRAEVLFGFAARLN